MIGSGRVLGIDLGSQRIGVAVTDSAQAVATGVTMVPRSGDRQADHRALAALVQEYGAVGMVVGVPVTLAGDIGPAARAILDEIAEMRRGLDVDVDTMDERLTTKAAAGSLRAAGKANRAQRAIIDQTAAAVLLQSWVDRRRAETARSEPGGGS